MQSMRAAEHVRRSRRRRVVGRRSSSCRITSSPYQREVRLRGRSGVGGGFGGGSGGGKDESKAVSRELGKDGGDGRRLGQHVFSAVFSGARGGGEGSGERLRYVDSCDVRGKPRNRR
jgi:hypothetical protein